MGKLLQLKLLIFIALTIGACSSIDRKKELQKVKRGMSKAEVIGLAGNPSRSGRVSGADKWSYDLFNNSRKRVDIIDVYFKAGKVQYIGSEKTLKKQLSQQIQSPKGQKNSKPDNIKNFRDL